MDNVNGDAAETQEAIELNQYLKTIYYDQRGEAGFSSPKVIYDYIRSRGERNVSMKQIVEYLKGEEVYTTHFPYKRAKYNTPVISPRIGYLFDVDSGYLPSASK